MGNEFARQHQRAGKVSPHRVDVVQDGEHRAAFAVPAPHHADQVRHRSRVDCRKGLVKQDEPCVLQQQAGKERSLYLPARQRPDRPLLEPFEADRGNRFGDAGAVNSPQARKAANLSPEAHCHEVGDRDRERPVDIRLLRQVGDLAAREPAKRDPAFERAE